MANYYYNGELLPELPVDDGYPYCFIRKNNDTKQFDAYLSITQLEYNGTVYSTANFKKYILPFDKSGDWTYSNNWYNSASVDSNRTIIFSNADIMSGSSVWLAGSEPVPETPLDEKKYLIKNLRLDGYELLTVADGAFQKLDTNEINAQTFHTYGFDEPPPSDLLVTLSKFELLLWHSNVEELPALTADITAIPLAQTVVTDLIDISDETILGVESITATATGSPLFAISFDGKQTWEAWTGSAWETLDSDVSGMTGDMMASIVVDQWAAKIAGLTGFHLKFILHDSDAVESVIVDFKN